jgi:multidrug transporter EmrE-like cation transporter
MPSMPSIVLFIAFGLCATASQILLKAGMTELGRDPRAVGALGTALAFATNGKLVMAAGLYVGTFALYMMLLARLPVGQAYPIGTALNFVLITLAGWWLLGENPTLTGGLGLFLIVAGIYVIARQ